MIQAKKLRLLNKTIKHVDKLFGVKDLHFVRTLYWLLQLEPEAGYDMQIAAYAHDVERAIFPYDIGAFFMDKEVLRKHQENGALEIYNFLLQEGAEPNFALKVKMLIERHEFGGTDGQNLIKDSDSISYLETNALKHTDWVEKFPKEKVKAKIDWMYNRISLDKAKEIARPLYEKAIKVLNEKAKKKEV